jgi:outer membrane protein assembly factor BamE (lipoprotein component of BamABCDE complex)
LQEITVGVQTKKDVEALIGSPTQTSTFDNNIWYYISAKTRLRPARQLALTDQEILIVNFDGQGVVRSLQRIGADEMRPIEMVSRETPTPGSDRSFLQSLFGNIGRVGAGGLSSGGQAPAGTTTQGGPQGPGAGALR